LGDLTVDQAAAAETKIVLDHAAKVAAIIALEEQLAEKSTSLASEVAARKKEIGEKTQLDLQKISDKALLDEQKRGQAIDKELAGGISRTAVDVAWGKTTPGAAVASTAQNLENKALEKILEKGFDKLGVGKALDKVLESLEQKIFGKAVDTAVDSTVSATANATAMAAPLTAQVAEQATAITVPIVAAIHETALLKAGAPGGGGIPGIGQLGSLFGSGDAAGESALASVFSGPEAIVMDSPFLLAAASGGMVVPSAAGGMTVNDGKGGRMIIAHPNEMMLPAHLSGGIQDMISGRAGQGAASAPAFHYSPTINAPETPDLKQLLARHGNDMLYWLQAQHRSGAYRIPA
jgi:hypothetical protein